MMGILLAILCGLITGIISNYLADVLPRHRKLTGPVCLNCGEKRSVTEFIQASACKACGKVNANRFWLVIVINCLLSLAVWVKPINGLPFAVSCILLVLFSVVVITDMEYRVILEQVSLVGYFLCAGAGWLLHGIPKTGLGGISGFIVFLALYYAGKLFAHRLSKNREVPIDEEALGFGDVHLAGVIGLLTGFPYVFTALLFAIVLGGIISAMFILLSVARKQYQAFQAIPYGPFIIIGGIIALYMY
jgi:prepilin signal peptidase PulO-like enzyme (type II secretory pathway)